MSDEDEYVGDIVLEWHGEHPNDLDERVIKDIRRSMWGLRCPSDLMFHHYFLSRMSDNGPAVFIYGEDGSDAFHCEYVEKVEWVTMSGKSDA